MSAVKFLRYLLTTRIGLGSFAIQRRERVIGIAGTPVTGNWSTRGERREREGEEGQMDLLREELLPISVGRTDTTHCLTLHQARAGAAKEMSFQSLHSWSDDGKGEAELRSKSCVCILPPVVSPESSVFISQNLNFLTCPEEYSAFSQFLGRTK